MGKKIDLNQKKNNAAFTRNKNSRSITSPYPLSPNSQDIENNQEEIPNQDTGLKNKFSPKIGKVNNPLKMYQNVKNQINSMQTEDKMRLLLQNPVVKKIVVKILIIAIPIILLLILILYIVIVITGSDDESISMGSYYSMRCPEVTVIFTDKTNNYEVTGTATYPLEEYVAGVVAGEVGFLGSLEVDKTFAVAARTFLLTHDDGNCTIESSDRKQVFRELTESSTDKLAIQAAKETAGQVLLSNNELYGTQYDAFACIAKDNNYYTIAQANQKIPIKWIEDRINPQNQPDWFICNGIENLRNHHGNGLSQYGSLYLATEKEYTYDQILEFYLGDKNIQISRGAYMTSIAGLEVKDTTNSQVLNEPLQNYLSNKGSSIDQLNNYIYESVSKNGKGTREGVVTAAVSLINFLYDNFNVRIPYYWGGTYQNYGVSPKFGGWLGASCSSTTCYYRSGLDCSGFVSWAIKNGGYQIGRNTTNGFDSKFSDDSCDITSQDCIGQPGDLINSRDCHIQMIVAVDQESGQYIVAESTGGNMGLIMRKWDMHSGNCSSSPTKILHMDRFYNNNSNIDPNY